MKQDLIIYSVLLLFSNTRTRNALLEYDYNWDYVRNYYEQYTTSSLVITARAGINNHPFVHEHNLLDYSMPEYNPNFSKTFGDVSDEAAMDALRNLPDGKKLCINWSGGLDSTVPLVAVLKNWSETDLKERLVVNMNDFSIYENPHVYYNYIKNRIQTINSYHKPDFDKYVTVYGEPEMPSTSSKKYLSLLNEYPGIYDMPLRENIDKYVEHFAKRINRNFAETNANKLMENINSLNGAYPVETMADLIWWENFNWTWKGCQGIDWFVHHYPEDSLERYLPSNINWFDTKGYQQWIMKNKGPGVSYGRDSSYIKRSHKEYIYEFDGNEFYYEFKSKLPASFWRIEPDWDDHVCMITSDYRNLTLRNDLDEIVSHIPGIIDIKNT